MHRLTTVVSNPPKQSTTAPSPSITRRYREHFDEFVALAAFLGRIIKHEDPDFSMFLNNTAYLTEALMKPLSPEERVKYLSPQ